jgi:hypothetical protein
MEAAFQVAVSAGAVRGEYPVHAFAEITAGGQGMLRVARTLRVDFPASSAMATAAPAGGGRVVEIGRPPELSGLNGLLERWRLEALSDYVRAEEDPVEGGIFRLGTGPESFKLAVIPGEQGLLDAWFLLTGPEALRVHFHGLRLALRLPAGVFEGDDPAPLQIDLSKPAGGDGKKRLGYEHYLSCGDWGTMVRIDIQSSDQGLEIRATAQDEIVSLGLGPADAAPVAMIGGQGIRVETGALGAADAARNLLKGPGIAFEFPGGLHLLATALGGFGQMQLTPNLQSPGMVAARAEGIRLTAGRNSPYKTVAALAKAATPSASPLQQRLWLDLDVPGFKVTRERLEELHRYDHGPKGVILRNWTDQISVLPGKDGPAPGPLAEFRDLEAALQQWGVVWGLNEEVSEVSPLADSFDYEDVAFGPDGDPLRGRSGRYLVRPDRVRAGVSPVSAKPGLLVLGQCDSVAEGFHDRWGHWFSPTAMASAWKTTMTNRRSMMTAGGLLLARSAGAWLPPGADGVLLPPVELASQLVPVPWPCPQGPGILRPTPEGGGARAELRTLLSGEGLVATHRDWGREVVRRAWFLRPVHAAMSSTGFAEIDAASPNHGRLRCGKGAGTTLWTNWSSEPWEVEGIRLAPWGFRAVAPGLEARRETTPDGAVFERSETPDASYLHLVDPLPRAAPVPVECRLELGDEGMARVEVNWVATEGLAFGTRPLWILFSRGTPSRIEAKIELQSSVPPEQWSGPVASDAEFSLGDLALGNFTAALVLVTPEGRPLSLGSTQTVMEGPFRGYACRVGQLTIERIEDGVVEELAFVSELDAAAKSRQPPSQRPVRALIDAGWGATNGGFRLERRKDGFRVIPLPDSGPFEIRLRPGRLGFPVEQVTTMKAIALYGGGSEAKPPPVVDGELRWDHDPRVFAYELNVR